MEKININKFENINKLKFVNKEIKDPFASNYYHTIYLSENDYKTYTNKQFVVTSALNEYFIMKISKSSDVSDGTYMFAHPMFDRIKNINNHSLYAYNDENVYKFVKPLNQVSEFIEKEIVAVSLGVYNKLKEEQCEFFIIYNCFDLSHFVVNFSHIMPDESLDDNVIRLNKKQRLALNFDDYIKIENKSIKILPLYMEFNNNFSICESLLKLYVGKVNYSLIVKRPMTADETFSIARLSKSNMQLLGVTDMDMVNVTYMGKTVKLRVMSMENDQIINNNVNCDKNDKEQYDILREKCADSLEQFVCIPLFVRNELGIPTVNNNISVKIERDMSYIWWKNFNSQILPIILILFSSEIFINLGSILISVLFSLLTLPIVLYFNLSKERSVAKKIKK